MDKDKFKGTPVFKETWFLELDKRLGRRIVDLFSRAGWNTYLVPPDEESSFCEIINRGPTNFVFPGGDYYCAPICDNPRSPIKVRRAFDAIGDHDHSTSNYVNFGMSVCAPIMVPDKELGENGSIADKYIPKWALFTEGKMHFIGFKSQLDNIILASPLGGADIALPYEALFPQCYSTKLGAPRGNLRNITHSVRRFIEGNYARSK